MAALGNQEYGDHAAVCVSPTGARGAGLNNIRKVQTEAAQAVYLEVCQGT